jgi:hypothetical protein
MGILPMSITGVPPVSSLLLLSFLPKKKQDMGKMPMRLTGGTPVLRRYFWLSCFSKRALDSMAGG